MLLHETEVLRVDVSGLHRTHNTVSRQIGAATDEPRRGALEETHLLDFGLESLRAAENKFWLFKTPRLQYLIMVLPEASTWSAFI